MKKFDNWSERTPGSIDFKTVDSNPHFALFKLCYMLAQEMVTSDYSGTLEKYRYVIFGDIQVSWTHRDFFILGYKQKIQVWCSSEKGVLKITPDCSAIEFCCFQSLVYDLLINESIDPKLN